MAIWHINAGPYDSVAMLSDADPDRRISPDPFDTDNQPVVWRHRPQLAYDPEDIKKSLPRTDAIPYISSSFVLNAKARDALGPLLEQFGQMLALNIVTDQGNETGYYYNLTHAIEFVDHERSFREPYAWRANVVVLDGAVPSEPAVFTDTKWLGRGRHYVNDAAKQLLEDAAKAHGITGLVFYRADITPAEAEAKRAAYAAAMSKVPETRRPESEGPFTSTPDGYLFAIDAEQLQPLIDDPYERGEEIIGHKRNGRGVNDYLELDFSTYAIHFMLTGTYFETGGPLGGVTQGAVALEHGSTGYCTPEEVRIAAEALRAITPKQFAARFDPEALHEADISPEDRWQGDNALTIDDILPYYKKVRAFYKAAAKRGDAVISTTP